MTWRNSKWFRVAWFLPRCAVLAITLLAVLVMSIAIFFASFDLGDALYVWNNNLD